MNLPVAGIAISVFVSFYSLLILVLLILVQLLLLLLLLLLSLLSLLSLLLLLLLLLQVLLLLLLQLLQLLLLLLLLLLLSLLLLLLLMQLLLLLLLLMQLLLLLLLLLLLSLLLLCSATCFQSCEIGHEDETNRQPNQNSIQICPTYFLTIKKKVQVIQSICELLACILPQASGSPSLGVNTITPKPFVFKGCWVSLLQPVGHPSLWAKVVVLRTGFKNLDKKPRQIWRNH